MRNEVFILGAGGIAGETFDIYIDWAGRGMSWGFLKRNVRGNAGYSTEGISATSPNWIVSQRRTIPF